MNTSKIVSIPEKMEKFYGKGKMLHPSIEDIENLIKTIPKGKVSTIEALGKRLAKDYETDVTCPMRAGNSIKKISRRYSNENIDYKVPFWRVIRTDKCIVKTDNYEFWASKVEDEGFQLSFAKSGLIKVIVTEENMFDF